jgi:hypothetical protein
MVPDIAPRAVLRPGGGVALTLPADAALTAKLARTIPAHARLHAHCCWLVLDPYAAAAVDLARTACPDLTTVIVRHLPADAPATALVAIGRAP